MQAIEYGIIQLLLQVFSVESLNNFLHDPRNVALMIGALVSVSGGVLGVFLVLRKMALTSDAISHTVLLGIVGAFLFLLAIGVESSLSSPWLLAGAALSGVLTVVFTEWLQRSQLVKADAALGLVFPLLFALAVILISRFAEDVHLDTDAVMVGEIGVAWANTNSYCFDFCDDVVITPDDARAEVGRVCTNCSRGGISPRDAEAIFEEVCSNCGRYTAAEAWSARLIDSPPTLVFFPKPLSVMGLISVVNVLFVALFYKELKLASFDEALAKTLGFQPVLLTYALMSLVSLTAVGAFDAVGSVLVVAFFVLPATSAYLLTDKLSLMLILSPLYGILGTFTGYDFASGYFLGLPMDSFLRWLDSFGLLQGYTEWNISISASIVLMTFFFFLVTWVFSPRYGVFITLVRRLHRQREFADQLLLGHLYHHDGDEDEQIELATATLHEHLNWSVQKVRASLHRTQARGWIHIHDGIARLTQEGMHEVQVFQSWGAKKTT